MALVLVEGEDKLPSLLGASNSKSPQSNGGATSKPTFKYLFSTGFVMCIATLLAVVF